MRLERVRARGGRICQLGRRMGPGKTAILNPKTHPVRNGGEKKRERDKRKEM